MTLTDERARYGKAVASRTSSLMTAVYCVARYIELNPVPAGMVARAADYRWSSYRCNAWAKLIHSFARTIAIAGQG